MSGLKTVIQVSVKMLRPGYQNVGPLTWNLTEGKLELAPGRGLGSKGIYIDDNKTTIGTASVAIDAAMPDVSIGEFDINHMSDVASTPLTPITIFNPSNSKYLFIIALASEIMDCLDDIDRDEYSQSVTYVYEVIDYDDFQPW
jgi:hypothetical protein